MENDEETWLPDLDIDEVIIPLRAAQDFDLSPGTKLFLGFIHAVHRKNGFCNLKYRELIELTTFGLDHIKSSIRILKKKKYISTRLGTRRDYENFTQRVRHIDILKKRKKRKTKEEK